MQGPEDGGTALQPQPRLDVERLQIGGGWVNNSTRRRGRLTKEGPSTSLADLADCRAKERKTRLEWLCHGCGLVAVKMKRYGLARVCASSFVDSLWPAV